MLDFGEVGRRIELRNQQVALDTEPISHEDVMSPLIGTLLDPEYHGGEHGTVLLTARECVNLGRTIQRQSQMLDMKDGQLADAMPVLESSIQAIELLSRKLAQAQGMLKRWQGGVIIAGLWASAVIAAKLL
jgi:hypothetical protein